jgi:hypothetical protein
MVLVMMLVAETEILPCAYRVSPFGPPQISEELPPHVILHRSSVAATLPTERKFPQ